MKKIVALLVAFVFTMSMGVSAFASDGGNGGNERNSIKSQRFYAGNDKDGATNALKALLNAFQNQYSTNATTTNKGNGNGSAYGNANGNNGNVNGNGNAYGNANGNNGNSNNGNVNGNNGTANNTNTKFILSGLTDAQIENLIDMVEDMDDAFTNAEQASLVALLEDMEDGGLDMASLTTAQKTLLLNLQKQMSSTTSTSTSSTTSSNTVLVGLTDSQIEELVDLIEDMDAFTSAEKKTLINLIDDMDESGLDLDDLTDAQEALIVRLQKQLSSNGVSNKGENNHGLGNVAISSDGIVLKGLTNTQIDSLIDRVDNMSAFTESEQQKLIDLLEDMDEDGVDLDDLSDSLRILVQTLVRELGGRR